jgi:hypothetical protein
MSMLSHYAIAHNLLKRAKEGEMFPSTATEIALAQVHATLALVDAVNNAVDITVHP